MSILQTTDLKKYYGTELNITKALDGVTLSIEEGEFVAIVGTSGSGKSTLLNMMGGLDTPTSGSIKVKGKELSKFNDEKLTIFRRRQIGFIFQNYNLVPVLNVYENIVLPVELDGDKVDKKFMGEVVRMLALEDKLNNLPYVAESIIVQQNDKLVGLVYPDFDEAFAHGLKNEDMERVMEENRVTLNEMLPAYSQISKMKIYPEEFEKTPKKSIKRFLYQEAKG